MQNAITKCPKALQQATDKYNEALQALVTADKAFEELKRLTSPTRISASTGCEDAGREMEGFYAQCCASMMDMLVKDELVPKMSFIRAMIGHVITRREHQATVDMSVNKLLERLDHVELGLIARAQQDTGLQDLISFTPFETWSLDEIMLAVCEISGVLNENRNALDAIVSVLKQAFVELAQASLERDEPTEGWINREVEYNSDNSGSWTTKDGATVKFVNVWECLRQMKDMGIDMDTILSDAGGSAIALLLE